MTDIVRWRKLGGDLAAKPGCDKPECYGQICVQPERCYGEGQPSDLTPERLAELRRIAEAATPGPYEVVGLAGIGGPYALRMTHRSGRTWYGVEVIKRREDAEYFGAVDRDTALALLDRIEALERERQTGVILTADDCNILMHGLRDRDELEGYLIPEALERYEELCNHIIDVGTGYGGGAEDA